MRYITPAERGFSLIEFAIASLATMVMMAAVFSLMTTMFTAGAGVSQIMQTQQNLRVAMNTISRDVTMAGTGLPTGGVAVPNGDDSAALIRPGVGDALATPSNSISVISPGNGAGPTISGSPTDAITITTIDQESPIWNVKTFDASGTDLEFVEEVRSGMFQLFPDDLLVFTNPNGSVFGCVTDVDKTASHAFFADKDAMNVNQPKAASGNLVKLKVDGDGITTATRINVVSYYIDNSNTQHPKLIRKANASAAQVIVEDVENLQLTFDLFDFANNKESSNQPGTDFPNQIRAVNISLSGRSPTLMPKTTKFYRFGLVSKVNVRNNTFRNRYNGS